MSVRLACASIPSRDPFGSSVFLALFARHKIPFAQIMQIERNSFLLLRNEEREGRECDCRYDMLVDDEEKKERRRKDALLICY